MLQTFKKYPICVSLPKGLDAVSIVQPLINTKPGFNKMEQWKVIKDFPDYMVSNYGRVFSKERIIKLCDGRIRLHKGILLKPRKDKRGYLYVGLYNNKKIKLKTVHRLVIEAFIPNPENRPETNHKDGIKNNNFVNNLEWNTRRENAIHSYKNRLQIPKQGENRYNALLKNSEVLEIKGLLKTNNLTKAKIGKKFKVSREIIYNISVNKNYANIK